MLQKVYIKDIQAYQWFELTSVYFLNKKFGLTWRMCQMKVYEPQRLHGFQFQIEDEPEIEEEPKLTGFQFQI